MAWLRGSGIVCSFSLLVTLGLAGVIQTTRWLEGSEIMWFDWLVRQQPQMAPDERLVIAALTEADISTDGAILSDQQLATVITILQEYEPAVIGVDFYRPTPKPPGHEELLQALMAENVVAIREYGRIEEPPGVPDDRVGFNNLAVDLDGVLRRNLLFASADESLEARAFYSLALRLSLKYLEEQAGDRYPFRVEPGTLYIGETAFPDINRWAGGYSKADDAAYQVLLRYRAPHASIESSGLTEGPPGLALPPVGQAIPEISISDILAGVVNPNDVRGRIVLIGSTAPSLKDQFGTPYRQGEYQILKMSGVVMHAQMTSQILSTVLDEVPLYGYWPQWGEYLWIFGCAVLGGALAWPFTRPWVLIPVAILGPSSILGVSWLGFTMAALWLPVMAPIAGFTMTGGAVIAYRLFYSAVHDRLTGLPNRDRFIQEVYHWLRRWPEDAAAPLVVMFLDLDRFRAVNDSMGHGAGDQVLKITVSRLKRVLRPYRTYLARVGGDEFAVALDPPSREAVAGIADQLQHEFMQPIPILGRDISTPLSIGIAFTQEGYEHKAEDLLRDSHTAMYRAKSLGKARHEVFATGMLTEVMNRIQLESDMRKGMEQHEFSLNYQPIVSLQTGRIAGFEALARWYQQQRGAISPGAFIPVAEETGLIVPLGQWIFEEACTQAQIWQAQFLNYPELSMSINLSGRQFSQPDLADQLQQVLRKTQIDGRTIKVEITESMVMGDVEAAIDLMLNLKSLNLHLGMDDFGTGYSSLSYLHRFPMDTLKVDQSFVSRMEESSEDYEIVRTIITLGHNLGMEIVAEGVETEAQVAMLRELNCEYGQGYFFARPLTPENATALLQENPQW